MSHSYQFRHQEGVISYIGESTQRVTSLLRLMSVPLMLRLRFIQGLVFLLGIYYKNITLMLSSMLSTTFIYSLNIGNLAFTNGRDKLIKIEILLLKASD